MTVLKLIINTLSSIMQIIVFDRVFSAYGDKQKNSNTIKNITSVIGGEIKCLKK